MIIHYWSVDKSETEPQLTKNDVQTQSNSLMQHSSHLDTPREWEITLLVHAYGFSPRIWVHRRYNVLKNSKVPDLNVILLKLSTKFSEKTDIREVF